MTQLNSKKNERKSLFPKKVFIRSGTGFQDRDEWEMLSKTKVELIR